MSADLDRLLSPSVPPELASRTMATVIRWEETRQAHSWSRMLDWASGHSRMVATMCSFLITLMCYGGILGQFKPIPYLRVHVKSPVIFLSPAQHRQIDEALGYLSGENEYTFPRVKSGSHVDAPLASLQTSTVVFVVLVRSDGEASLVEILQPESTPEMVQQVQIALGNLKFQPAMAAGQPVPTQLIVLMERLDVQG